jgi:hypothetical protein
MAGVVAEGAEVVAAMAVFLIHVAGVVEVVEDTPALQ